MKFNVLSFLAVGGLIWYFYRDSKKKQLKPVENKLPPPTYRHIRPTIQPLIYVPNSSSV